MRGERQGPRAAENNRNRSEMLAGKARSHQNTASSGANWDVGAGIPSIVPWAPQRPPGDAPMLPHGLPPERLQSRECCVPILGSSNWRTGTGWHPTCCSLASPSPWGGCIPMTKSSCFEPSRRKGRENPQGLGMIILTPHPPTPPSPAPCLFPPSVTQVREHRPQALGSAAPHCAAWEDGAEGRDVAPAVSPSGTQSPGLTAAISALVLPTPWADAFPSGL